MLDLCLYKLPQRVHLNIAPGALILAVINEQVVLALVLKFERQLGIFRSDIQYLHLER